MCQITNGTKIASLTTVDMIAARTNLTIPTPMDTTIVTVETTLMTGTQTLAPITQMKNHPTMIQRLKTLQSPRVKVMRMNSI